MEKVDPDISRWVLEFLLRSAVPDTLIQKTLTILPVSAVDSRIKKILLLRTLQSQLSKASLTETTLQILENLEELDRNDAVPVSDSMRCAYCAVAVECTVKYLAASPDDPAGEYFDAVRRIWRERMNETERRRSELYSGELSRWRDDVEAALWNPEVSEILANLNSRRDALKKVKVYLKEAWKIMGPSFLETVAKMSKGGSTKEKRHSVGGDRSESDDNEDEEQFEERVRASVDANHELGRCYSLAQRDKDNADNVRGVNECEERLEERVGASVDANQEVGGCDLPAQRDKDSYDNVPSGNECEEQLEERVGASVDANQEVGGCDLPAQRDKVAIQKGNLHRKRKHSALRSCNRGVMISGVEKALSVKPLSGYDSLPSPEVREVQESLKSSSLRLRSLVKDPLPDALHTSEVVRSELAAKEKNLQPRIENHVGVADVVDSEVCMAIVPYQPNDAGLGKMPAVHCNNGYHSNHHRPSLMERKRSARTYEWDDSIDNRPQGKQPRRRKMRWTPLEEETLMAGVKLFGEGNWASIRNFYSNVFENRTGGDLKDKWRNMMR